MWDIIFGSVYGWIGTAGLIVLACAVIGYIVPAWRPYVIAVGLVAVSVATAFTKGWLARGERETKLKDEAVRKAQKNYDEIDARPDTADDAVKRMRDGSF